MNLLNAESLVRLLEAGRLNHSVIANNLANLNTPGYRTGRVKFSRALDDVLDAQGNIMEGSKIGTEFYRPLYDDVSRDGNDVELAREMAELNKNDLRMRLYLNVLGVRIRKMRDAIRG